MIRPNKQQFLQTFPPLYYFCHFHCNSGVSLCTLDNRVGEMTMENFHSIQWKQMLNLAHCLRCARASPRIQSRLQRLLSSQKYCILTPCFIPLPYHNVFRAPSSRLVFTSCPHCEGIQNDRNILLTLKLKAIRIPTSCKVYSYLFCAEYLKMTVPGCF